MDAQPAVGRKFHLLARIGAGAFGEVYLAEQESGAGFRKKVAIKILSADMRRHRDAVLRMRDEARILGRLSHRHIVAVLDLVRLGENWAVIMDYVPGADLEQVLLGLARAKQSFPAPAALEVASAVLSALHAASTADNGQGGQLGVIHRDIKPANVRLTPDGDVKVLDFGVARVDLDTREAQTRARGWIGTERYMSPERILCEGDSAAGDVYAAMATLLELLRGEPLGRTPVLPERHDPFVEAALDSVRGLLDGPSEVVDEVIERLRDGLAADPAQRPSAEHFRDALATLARRLRGEGLAEFARRFVPEVDRWLGSSPEPAEGVLAEGTDPTGRSQPTLVNLDNEGATQGEPTLSPTRPKGQGVAVLAGGFALLGGGVLLAVMAMVVVLVVGVPWRDADLPAPDAGVTESAPPVVEPVQAPPDPEPAPAQPEEASDRGSEAPVAGPLGGRASEPTAKAPPAPAASRSPAPRPDAPRVSRAMVAFPEASSLEVDCGGVVVAGTRSVRIVDFPAGSCRVEAVYLGTSYSTVVSIEAPREVPCSVVEGALSCGAPR